MSDATYIELPMPPRKRRPLLRGWRGAVLLLFILAAILAGCFSWWLSQGKISSYYARVDSIVYTVQSEITARLNEIYVYQGQDVVVGQPLAQLAVAQESTPPVPASQTAISEISTRLNTTQETEKSISARLAKARTEEETLRKAHQDRVTEHVSALLALRSVSPGHPSYQYASQAEEAARARMDAAREQFENVSKARAAMEVELARIRYEMQRKKQRGQKTEPKVPPQPVAAAAPPPSYLYAPLNGRIVGINGAPGQTVQKGQQLFLILPPDNGQNGESWIQAWFPLSTQRLLKAGQQANIKIGSRHLFGRVVAVATEPQYLPTGSSGQQYAQYIPVQISVDDPAQLAHVAPGTSVECQIQTRYALGENLF